MENKELEALKEKYADYIASLSPEDKAKVDACTTAEELINLANNAEGELPDDVLEAVAGGADKGSDRVCPYSDCGSADICTDTITGRYRCMRCGRYFD